MNTMAHQKVKSHHLKRNAYLYVRQSTLRQVLENTESTKRQYALRQQAIALGWPTERVVTIDSDLGQSGANADRAGFQKLVAEVSMNHAGIVLGLEVSRLARNSTDWHRLLEICALTGTLILDEDGIYDPNDFNDRLLLGLKGTMSEAELHILQSRMRGGLLSKARRGELKMLLPVGFVYDERDRVVLDPDAQVQQALHTFFQLFRREGSAFATVRAFNAQRFQFPMRLQKGLHKGELVWSKLVVSRALQMLHNPRYAGAFSYGKKQTQHAPDRKKQSKLTPREDWHSLIRDAHEGYISWEEREANLQRLRENAQALGNDRQKSPPREGNALLQGIILCGKCGLRMGLRYHTRGSRRVPDYVCQKRCVEHAEPVCQHIPGGTLDEAIGELLLEIVSPLAVEVTLAVQQELQTRKNEVDILHWQQVERARYEMELARRRYMRVDPDNRLVADELEAGWNAKLRELAQAQESYEMQCQAQPLLSGDQQASEILTLAADFPRLWKNPHVPDRDRKRMVRLLIEDVTLLKQKHIVAHIRFKGGVARTLEIPIPLRSFEEWTTSKELVQEIDQLLNDHYEQEVAQILNERGMKSGKGHPLNKRIIAHISHGYNLKDRFTRLREAGMLTVKEMASELSVSTTSILRRRNKGRLVAHPYNDRGECLYEPIHG